MDKHIQTALHFWMGVKFLLSELIATDICPIVLTLALTLKILHGDLVSAAFFVFALQY